MLISYNIENFEAKIIIRIKISTSLGRVKPQDQQTVDYSFGHVAFPAKKGAFDV